MKDYAPRRYTRGENLWAYGLTAFLLLYIILLLWGPAFEVERQAEMRELKTLLAEGKELNRYFEFVAAIRAEPNLDNGRRGRALGDALGLGQMRREWSVLRAESGVSGHFTFAVSGRKRVLLDQRTTERFVVFFEKPSGQPIRITKIDTYCGRLANSTP